MVDIVLDHRLHAELPVMKGEGKEGDGERGPHRLAEPSHDSGPGRTGERHESGHEPDRERHYGDCGEALHPPVMDASPGSTETARAGKGGAGVGHALTLT